MDRLAFHLVVVVHHLYVANFYRCIDTVTVSNETVEGMLRMRGSFLTGWNFAIQSTYFVVSLAEDILRLSNRSELYKLLQLKPMRAFKNGLFTTIIFPVSCFVCLSFWSFFTYDRELVYPSAVDVVLPLWFNHSLHTSIVVAAILELWLVFHPYPRRKLGLACLLAFNGAYVICILLTRYYIGLWVYPMFYLMNWPQRIAFFTVSQLIVWGLYEIGFWLNTAFWGEKARQKINGQTGKKLT